MSYSYRYVDHSDPSTPQVFTWDVTGSEHDLTPQPVTPLAPHYPSPEEQEQQFQQYLQPQPQPQPPQLQLQAQLPPPPPPPQQQYQPPAQIQLPERPTFSAQFRFDNITQEEFRQHQQATASDDRKAETSGNRRASSKPPLHISTASRASTSPGASSSAAGRSTSSGVGPARHTRVAQSAHPYRRPHSASAVRAGARVSSAPVATLHPVAEAGGLEPEPELELPAPAQIPMQQQMPQTRPSIGSVSTITAAALAASAAVTCPAVSLWREQVVRRAEGDGAGASSTAQPPARRYNVCTDLQFDTVDNVLVAMLELPGVKRADVRICLATCPFSRVKQLTVSGTSRAVLATERGHTIRERKCGNFAKSISVPPETQPQDVHATMEDGVLTLRIPGGQPMQAVQPQDVPLV